MSIESQIAELIAATTALADQVNVSKTALTTAVAQAQAAAAAAANTLISTWARTSAFSYTASTVNGNGAMTSANVVWPDGTTGLYTADTLSGGFPGKVDAWHVTYGSKTITQPAVTRNGAGVITILPALVITG